MNSERKGKTWSRCTNWRLPFDVNVFLHPYNVFMKLIILTVGLIFTEVFTFSCSPHFLSLKIREVLIPAIEPRKKN